jgi:ribosome-binding factor A
MRDVASYRMRRVNEAIKEIIATALSKDLKDPRIGFVTLTGVETAQDLTHAKVFFSVYGKQVEKDATMEALRHSRPFLQRLIADEMKLRRTPALEFVYDESVDRGMRIQAMLKSTGVADLPPLVEDDVAEAESEETEAADAEGEDAEGDDAEGVDSEEE